jgi:hypothetical protein
MVEMPYSGSHEPDSWLPEVDQKPSESMPANWYDDAEAGRWMAANARAEFVGQAEGAAAGARGARAGPFETAPPRRIFARGIAI